MIKRLTSAGDIAVTSSDADRERISTRGGRGDIRGDIRGDVEAHASPVAVPHQHDRQARPRSSAPRVSTPADPPVLTPAVAAVLLRILTAVDNTATTLDGSVTRAS